MYADWFNLFADYGTVLRSLTSTLSSSSFQRGVSFLRAICLNSHAKSMVTVRNRRLFVCKLSSLLGDRFLCSLVKLKVAPCFPWFGSLLLSWRHIYWRPLPQLDTDVLSIAVMCFLFSDPCFHVPLLGFFFSCQKKWKPEGPSFVPSPKSVS